jgi:hypothetical protein
MSALAEALGMIHRSIWLAVGLWLVALPLAAQAEGDGAREKFMRGQRAYQQGDYDQAIAEWQAAYELDPRPLILYNLSQAYERYGKLPEAVQALEQYLEQADPDDPNMDVARARVSTLRERLAKTSIRVVDAPEGASIFVDGKPWGRTPRPDPIPVEPGSHVVVVRLAGHQDFRATVGVPAGQSVEVAPEMEVGGAGKRSIAPYIVGGAGAALVLVAGITGGIALSKAKGADTADSDAADSARSMARVADVLGIVGGAAIGAGIVWWILDRRKNRTGKEEAAVSITPVFSPGGAGASATVRF